MAKLLLGKEVTDALNEKLMERTAALKEQGIIPTLAIIRCGANPSDLSYDRSFGWNTWGNRGDSRHF